MNFKRFSTSDNQWHDVPYYQHKTATDTLSLPAVIYPNDTSITVGLKGNTVQNGTPTHNNPIMPNGTGERTGNLFDEVYSDISGTIRYRPIFVGDGTFTLSTTTPYDSSVANVFLLSGNVSSGASTLGNGVWLNHKVTTQSIDGYVTIAYRHYNGTTSPADCKTILNSGSTALPYEPYGVKIPISSANTTTPVYLGEVETTRRIKKLVLTGQETIYYNSSNSTFYFVLNNGYYTGSVRTTPLYCSHYIHIDDGRPFSNIPNNSIYIASYGSDTGAYIYSTNYVDLADFKTNLQQQYAAGTPVTVWYVLATETTGIVNEPLRKIGDYADEVSGITIPTTAGANTLSIGTALQPSEVTVNYKGWHPVADVHEADNGAWT